MSTALPRPVARVIDEFARLPGVGSKTASRLAFHLLRADREQARALAAALTGLADGIVTCSRCCNIAESDPCPVCADPARETAVVCVVEEPLDVLAIERTGSFRGLFHVLHGAISPVDGITPADLKIKELVLRVESEPIREVILATNPSLEGDATAMYIERSLRAVRGTDVRITRLARGLPIGGDIEYADEVTLARALEGRRDVDLPRG